MARARKYTDAQLARAIASSDSWRGSMRALGLVATSSGAMRSVRAHADRLGLDYAHFNGQRRWTDGELGSAVAASRSWSMVAETLGIRGVGSIAALKGHAARLGLESGHFEPRAGGPLDAAPDVAHLRRAGSMLAAAWFALCGHDVSWPLEPARYDLLVHTNVGMRKVQVKTTTARAASTWKVYLSTSQGERRVYDPDEVDDFFIIDGDLQFYLVPVRAVGGFTAIHLGAYEHYRVAGFWDRAAAVSGVNT